MRMRIMAWIWRTITSKIKSKNCMCTMVFGLRTGSVAPASRITLRMRIEQRRSRQVGYSSMVLGIVHVFLTQRHRQTKFYPFKQRTNQKEISQYQCLLDAELRALEQEP